MSISCPRCSNSIEQDFGVITCSKCHAVLFIDMEGQIQVSNEAQASDFAPPAVMPEAPQDAPRGDAEEPAAQFQIPELPPMPEVQQPSPAPMPPPKAMMPVPPKGLPKRPGLMNAKPGAPRSGLPGMMAPKKRTQGQAPRQNNPFMPQADRAPAADASTSGFEILQSGNLNEVSDFGNTQQDFGSLSYFILIENIDTSATREKLFEVLSDEKFQWDPREVIMAIKKGRLELGHLNPVKASILVRKLQEVPVKVSWVQKLL
jgi:hypothetical protein